MQVYELRVRAIECAYDLWSADQIEVSMADARTITNLAHQRMGDLIDRRLAKRVLRIHRKYFPVRQ